ncbi:hypothetical protein JB92DRAFT_992414 [Gautieria morchelliformis]|nr:hypothetical protein JB92DRAFT_992414 [Gautieria morchelliformis]
MYRCLGGDTMPQGVEPDHQSANLSAQTVAAFNYYRTEAQSNEPPSPHHGQPNMSQKSMPPPPPPPPPAAQKPPLLPVARYNFLGSPVQSAGQPRAPSTPHHITRARAISISAKDGVIPSAIMPTSRATAFSLERLSPHRKASYKALMGEHYIGELEPFRAFCTLCHRWVDLSSRTPYSYGVWKGHVRKTDKHSRTFLHLSNRLRIGNTEDGYDTTSDRSQEDSGAPAAPETARDNRRSVVKTPATKGHNETLKVSSAPPSKVEPTIHSTQNQNGNNTVQVLPPSRTILCKHEMLS